MTLETAHLGTAELADLLARFAPAHLIPALRLDAGILAWDSLAIAETLAERYPDVGLLAGAIPPTVASPARSPPRCIRASARSARPAR